MQREVWESSRLSTKLNLVLIRPSKDPADLHWFVAVVVPSQVFLIPQNVIMS